MRNQSNLRLGRFAPTLTVSDIACALDFYQAALGLAVTFENGNPVGFVILKRDEAELHLTLDPDHKPSTSNVAHLLVNDVELAHAACVQAGGRITKKMRGGVGADASSVLINE